MMEELLKILAICLIASALGITFKQKAPEYTLFITLVAGVIVATVIFKNIAEPVREISDKLNNYGVKTEYFKVALKAVGIAYITDFIADSCRESGLTSMATKAELAGRAAIFLLSAPLFVSVFETAVGFLK
ncbi:MAG: SpoIIIAC/SpoIIIAD family protein [Acutalibacteraceae bacterium]|jgi:stage III sporulation protein AD